MDRRTLLTTALFAFSAGRLPFPAFVETALAQGRLDERKAAIAKELLSRRWQDKSEKIKGSYGWLGHVAAAVALALVAIRRLLRRT